MKKHLLGAVVLTAFATSAFADTTVKISGVHLCCGKCVTAAEKAVNGTGATGTADKEAKTVTIKAADDAAAQKAADALVSAGFFGSSDNAAVKISSASGAKDETVKSATVKGLHLCCDKCTKGINAALQDIKGVSGNTAAKGVESFEVKGDFNTKELASALEKAGYSAKISN